MPNRKEDATRQYSLDMTGGGLRLVSTEEKQKELTEDDLPDIAADAPWQVIRDYHSQAKAFGVSVPILKYAHDHYHGDYELFLDIYKNTKSISEANALMRKDEGGGEVG